MPAKSKVQQRFMGMVHAAQKGELDNPSSEVEKAADSMSDADAKDYASTKHKGLPNHVKKENMESELKEILRQTYRERLRESVNEDATELPQGTIPSAVKVKLQMAIDKIKDSKLSNNAKLQLVAQVIDALDVDKSQLSNIANKIRSKMESVNESISHEAMGIASMTNTRKEAVQKFIDDNNLDAKEILTHVTKGKLPERIRFVQALVGTPNNSSFKWYVKNYANESVVTEGKKVFKVNPGIGKAKYSISSHDGVKKHKDGSDFYDINIFKNKVDLEKGIKDYKSKGFVEESVIKEGVYKTILSNNTGKLFFSLVDDETDKVTDIDAKAWLKSTIKDKSSDNSKELVLSALVRQINQFNKKVDFNMWSNANKPTWEEKVKYLFDKGLANNVNKTGIKVH